jgi:hypothetical protein
VFLVNVYGLITSDLTGGVQFEVDDVLGQQVPNAAIRLHDDLLQADVGPFYTDTNGFVTITNLQEGGWEWQVVAPGSATDVGTVNIVPGEVVYQHDRLSRNLVTVVFNVVPIPYTDKYEIQVEQTFETHVPTPVLVLDPAHFEFTTVETNFETTYIVKVSNAGLIAVSDVEVTGSQDGATTLTPLIAFIPALSPQQVAEVPFVLAHHEPPDGTQQQQQGILHNFQDCTREAILGPIYSPIFQGVVAGVVAAQCKCVKDGKPYKLVVVETAVAFWAIAKSPLFLAGLYAATAILAPELAVGGLVFGALGLLAAENFLECAYTKALFELPSTEPSGGGSHEEAAGRAIGSLIFKLTSCK